MPVPSRVLVVDDEAAIRRPLTGYLRARGCTVDEAADGAEGLRRLLAADYDVVVSDLHMPGLDGLELWAEACRARPALAARWIFVSALPLPDAAAALAPRYIAKPFDVEEIWTEVRAVVRRDGTAGA